MSDSESAKQKRGFALMSPEKRREMARKGAKAVQAKGLAHQWNAETAKVAGKKGGTAFGYKKKASKDTGEASNGG